MHPMDSFWPTMMWKQFGAAVDMLDNTVAACPDALWRQPVWHVLSDPSQGVEFWYVAYHALFWLDLYLVGSAEGFAPPAPFTLSELDPAGALPERIYTKEELRAYLASLRQRCHTTFETMTDERARQPASFPWMADGEAFSYVELQLYNMRHIQEHAAQLSLLLGQHGVQADLDWVPRAKDDADAS